MGQAFPGDDPVARWLVTLSIGLNDVIFANRKFEEGLEDHEMSEYFRLASGIRYALIYDILSVTNTPEPSATRGSTSGERVAHRCSLAESRSSTDRAFTEAYATILDGPSAPRTEGRDQLGLRNRARRRRRCAMLAGEPRRQQ